MKITRDQMQSIGYLFNESGEGYSEALKGKIYNPNGFDAFISTGHYIDRGEYVNFRYQYAGGSDREFDYFPE